jgi:hypothetical protein
VFEHLHSPDSRQIKVDDDHIRKICRIELAERLKSRLAILIAVKLDAAAVISHRFLDEQKVTQAIFRDEYIRAAFFNCHGRLPRGEW